jgi:hypothetical protein
MPAAPAAAAARSGPFSRVSTVILGWIGLSREEVGQEMLVKAGTDRAEVGCRRVLPEARKPPKVWIMAGFEVELQAGGAIDWNLRFPAVQRNGGWSGPDEITKPLLFTGSLSISCGNLIHQQQPLCRSRN